MKDQVVYRNALDPRLGREQHSTEKERQRKQHKPGGLRIGLARGLSPDGGAGLNAPHRRAADGFAIKIRPGCDLHALCPASCGHTI